MSPFLSITLGLLLSVGALAESHVARELSFRWDSLRFALGILTSDDYQEYPLLVLSRTAEGGILTIYDFQKTTQRTLTEAQVASIVSRLSVYFADAGSPPSPDTQLIPPAFHMRLAIDSGFNRTSFFHILDPIKDAERKPDYARFIRDLSASK